MDATESMVKNMNKQKTSRVRLAAVCVPVCLLAMGARADELTLQVEQGLAALGYDTGPVDGTQTVATTVAISKFQAQNDMEVSGEVSPVLLGRIVARANSAEPPASSAAQSATADRAGSTPPAAGAGAVTTAQQACLQKLAEEKEKSSRRRRGLGSLVSAANRVASRFGVGQEVVETARDAAAVSGAASDLASAARDFGLTPEEAESCRTP